MKTEYPKVIQAIKDLPGFGTDFDVVIESAYEDYWLKFKQGERELTAPLTEDNPATVAALAAKL